MSSVSVSDTLQSLRLRAGERFTALGWPTPRLEEWKYTNLAPVAKVQWRPASGPVSIPPGEAMRLGGAAAELVFVNGILAEKNGAPVSSPAPWSRRGVAGEDTGASTFIATNFTSAGPAIEEHLGKYADLERQAMVALNTSQFVDGALIDVPAGKVVDGFIHLLFIGHGDGVWSHPRVLIVAGSNSQVTVVETYVGTGAYFTNAVTEIVAGDGAVVDHYRVECESREAFHTGAVYSHQQRSSSFTSRNVAIGGAIVRNDLNAVLAGEGASLVFDGLFVGTGNQHIDNHTTIDHASPHCDSQELYKGVLDEQSRGVFDGRIVVRPDAQKTISRQENHNLLLSETAIIDSKPTLEIHNDDVKCNHGSTIGQIAEEPMFYLRSRGISESDARSLLVYAFAAEIVDRMKLEAVQEHVRRALFRQMPERLPERRESPR
ncbi:MAG TPA: Fe-S cluster assembly protein SufD [Thermoanaerobaculia bacterium]|nr:Fe-S cluster assembly protein SufD [Thermoanaerobaculia bacterium]